MSQVVAQWDASSLSQAVAPSHLSLNLSPAISGLKFQSELVNRLKACSSDLKILYPQEFRLLPDFVQQNQQFNARLVALGFIRQGECSYSYKGSNPAKALQAFLKLRPLVLDCATVIRAQMLLILCDLLGEENFNLYIQKACNGVLLLSATKQNVVPTDSVMFQPQTNGVENTLPKELMNGDRLYYLGPKDCYSFHPTSHLNGYNVVVQIGNNNQVSLVGFVSQQIENLGFWSPPSQLSQLLLDKFNTALTFRDLACLLHHHETQKHVQPMPGGLSLCEAYAKLHALQPEVFEADLTKLKALKLKNDPRLLDQLTSIFPPKAQNIVGVISHSRVQDVGSVAQLIDGISR